MMLLLATKSMHLVKDSLRQLRMKQALSGRQNLNDGETMKNYTSNVLQFVCEGILQDDDLENAVEMHVLAQAMSAQQQRAEVQTDKNTRIHITA